MGDKFTSTGVITVASREESRGDWGGRGGGGGGDAMGVARGESGGGGGGDDAVGVAGGESGGESTGDSGTGDPADSSSTGESGGLVRARGDGVKTELRTARGDAGGGVWGAGGDGWVEGIGGQAVVKIGASVVGLREELAITTSLWGMVADAGGWTSWSITWWEEVVGTGELETSKGWAEMGTGEGDAGTSSWTAAAEPKTVEEEGGAGEMI
jgi:hypothetical protein